MAGGSDEALLAKVRALDVEAVLLCGHEPHLSAFASKVLTGSSVGLSLEFKKAAVCAIELNEDSAWLLWHLGPSALRRMALAF